MAGAKSNILDAARSLTGLSTVDGSAPSSPIARSVPKYLWISKVVRLNAVPSEDGRPIGRIIGNLRIVCDPDIEGRADSRVVVDQLTRDLRGARSSDRHRVGLPQSQHLHGRSRLTRDRDAVAPILRLERGTR